MFQEVLSNLTEKYLSEIEQLYSPMFSKDDVICPWCYSMTVHVYGEESVCSCCNNPFHDGDLCHEDD